MLRSVFLSCSSSRSALLLDNVHIILPSTPNIPGMSPTKDANVDHLALLLVELFRLAQERRRHLVIASVTQPDMVHSTLRARLGSLFPSAFQIPLPVSETARDFFASSMRSHGIHLDEDLVKNLASYLVNFTPQDILSLAGRVVMSERGSNESLNGLFLSEKRFRSIKKGFSPLALSQLHLFSQIDRERGEENVSQTTDLDKCVGGMMEAKKKLHNMITLPTQNPKLYSSFPIKMRSGMLCFGPPGCGKTHLVTQFVQSLGLNSVVLNGPEVLDKYIGSSEAKVRECFEQAHRARPCVLFIDEIDACARQRGQDHTGVTDRVVNQLLCHLDGVESRAGVFVVGATSRPEMLDLALLRPGRLDSLVYCSLPTREERIEVLRCASLARNLKLENDAVCEEISDLTEGWSHADLCGVISTAYMLCVKDSVDLRAEKAAMHLNHVINQNCSYQICEGELTLSAEERRDLESQLDKLAKKISSSPESFDSTTFFQSQKQNSSISGNQDSQNTEIVLKDMHLKAALDSLNSSVSESERLRHERIADRILRRKKTLDGKTLSEIVPDSHVTLM